MTTTTRPWRRKAITLALLVATAARLPAQAQQPPKAEPDDFVKDVLKALLGPNWNVFLNGGATTQGELLLQRPTLTSLEERKLTTNTGYNIGFGGGVDYLLRAGIRMSYAYSSSDLEYRTNNGNGSTNLDIDNIGNLNSHALTLEVMRYMLPSRSTVTPYASLGVIGTWWKLSNGEPLIDPAGGSTQFRYGGLVSFGAQVKMNDHFSARIEMATNSLGNPFNGGHAFRATTGSTIDEPTKVNQKDYRIAGVYHFGKPPQLPQVPVMTKR